MNAAKTMRSKKNLKRATTSARVMDMCRQISELLGSKHTVSADSFHKIPMPNPGDFRNAREFSKEYLLFNLLRKNAFLDLGVDKKAVAFSNFIAVERNMALKNRTLLDDCNKVAALPVIQRASRKISRLLGPFSWDHVIPHLDMTGGASTRLKRVKGNAGFKFCGKPHCTPLAAPLVNLFLYTDPVYMANKLKFGPVEPRALTTVVPSSRLDFVPKSYKTDRTIAIEPEMNMFFQRGIGRLIRKKLLRVGINLKDQSRNQYLAYHGSVMGDLATIDLEAASDSVSLELCRQLLPFEWMEAMDRVRSHSVTLPDGTLHKLSKISSMGNGFTFELETLVFWSLCSAVLEEFEERDKTVAVYGDDIVVPCYAAARVTEVLLACGFKTNSEKTFVSGPFRESCGKHYFLGMDVSPFNIKDLHGDITDELLVYNSFSDWMSRMSLVCPSPRKFGIIGKHPIVPPRYGLRAGLVSKTNPYRCNSSGMFTLEYYTYRVEDANVPHFGNYYMTLLRAPRNPRSEVRVVGRQLVRRKSENPVSIWD